MAEESIFPRPEIFEPTSNHTHTVILLHGRGSSSQEFADDLFAAELSTEPRTLRQRFPSYRWVFLSARTIRSTAFQEDMPAWFEAHSLTDISARSELQVPGIEESLKYLRKILEGEIGRIQNNSDHVFVGGISQGAAVGIWAILSEVRLLGGFFGASCWLPFDRDVVRYLDGERPNDVVGDDEIGQKLARSLIALGDGDAGVAFPHTPIFLGHGLDDAYVDVQLGRAARDALSKAGYSVEWKEYCGADEEGHWLKEPEQVDDIASFLQRAA
jgi:lysophospholipase II